MTIAILILCCLLLIICIAIWEKVKSIYFALVELTKVINQETNILGDITDILRVISQNWNKR